jgi:hypothetical protein
LVWTNVEVSKHVFNVVSIGCPPDLADIMVSCWKLDPNQRIDAKTVVETLRSYSNSLTERRKITLPWNTLNTMKVQVTRQSIAQDEELKESLPVVTEDMTDVSLKKLEVPKGISDILFCRAFFKFLMFSRKYYRQQATCIVRIWPCVVWGIEARRS